MKKTISPVIVLCYAVNVLPVKGNPIIDHIILLWELHGYSKSASGGGAQGHVNTLQAYCSVLTLSGASAIS